MQFLEASVLALRSARHRWTGPSGGTVTLYPMAHVAEAEFYRQVHAGVSAADFVLHEGVDSPVARRLTASYRWIDTRRLGLVVQPRAMFRDLGERAILADLAPAEFEALWRELSWHYRVAVATAAPAIGLWRRFTAARPDIARGMCQNDLPSRNEVMAWSSGTAPFLNALLTARDARLCRVLKHLLAGDGRGADIAVVYGAAHMPALVRLLSDADHALVESRWLTVIGL